MRNLKAFGLVLVAILAMSAMAASMASADDLTAEQEKVVLSGKNEPPPVAADKFTITAGDTSCKEVIYDKVTVTTPTTTVTVTPTYPTITAGTEEHNCKSLGFPATIDMNGCAYEFHITRSGSTLGDVTIECPKEKEITVTAFAGGTIKCTIHVPPQTLSVAANPDPVAYTNIGAGKTREITIKVTYGNLSYKHTKGTGLGACTEGAAATGSFTGTGLVTATNDAETEHVGIFLS